jgi:hypothetical protein
MKKGSERPVDDVRMELTIGEKFRNALRSIIPAIPHPDGALRQFVSPIRQGMGLQIMDHLKLVLDVAQK